MKSICEVLGNDPDHALRWMRPLDMASAEGKHGGVSLSFQIACKQQKTFFLNHSEPVMAYHSRTPSHRTATNNRDIEIDELLGALGIEEKKSIVFSVLS